MQSLIALEEFLLTGFNLDELRHFLWLRYDMTAVQSLDEQTSLLNYVDQLTRLFERHGWINDTLIDALTEERPARSAELEDLRRVCAAERKLRNARLNDDEYDPDTELRGFLLSLLAARAPTPRPRPSRDPRARPL